MNKITFLFVTALFFYSTAFYAQQEYLDETFGANGVILQYYNGADPPWNYESEFKVMAIQSDGKIITGSDFHQHGPNRRYVINQYNSDGTLNTGFGTNGFVVSNLNNALGALQLQSDGKIIACSVEGNYDSSFSYLIRYHADGTLDNSFGTDGTVVDVVNTIKAFSIQSDGNILVGKLTQYYGFSSNFKIVKYRSNGMLDNDFGSNGEVDFSLPQSKVFLEDIRVQNDGKILARALVRSDNVNDYSSNILFVRFESNGSLDSAFGNGGIKIFDYSDNDYVNDFLIQSDGRIVFLLSNYGVDSLKGIIRLNPNGTLDETFGIGGIKIIDYPILSIRSIQQLSNGKLIVAGIYETSVNPSPENNPTPSAVVIARFSPNGNLDLDFGQSGYIITTRENHRVLDDKLIVQSDGKILVGATFSNPWFSTHPGAAVLRYDTEKALFIPEFENSFIFSVYPNPIGEIVTMDFHLQQSEALSVDLYDNGGRLISNLLNRKAFFPGMNSQQLQLPSSLSNGLYLLKINSESNTITVKLIK